MRLIKSIIKEKDILNKVTSHKKAIDSALEKAKRLGQGSSRAVFTLIDPQYGETVIKIAKNKKGLAQNEFELGILRDRFHPDILPELYDYDKDSAMLIKSNGQPLWLQVEKVNKISSQQFEQLLNIHPEFIDYYLCSVLTPNAKHISTILNSEQKKKYEEDNIKEQCDEDEFVQELLSLAGNYGLDIGDLTTSENYGEKDGKLIIVDVGLSEEIFNKYYRRK
jgi:hypothetical protein